MTRLLTIIFFTGISLLTFGQVNEMPIHYGQFFNNPQINPASGGREGNIEFTLGSKQNTGKFSGVHNVFISSYFRIKQNENNFHVIGLRLNKDKEGAFIRRNRAYLTFSRHQKILEKWYLSVGVSGGYYSFSIVDNPVTGGISTTTLDGNAGVLVYSERSRIGLSINQINGGQVQPIEQQIKLIPQYNLIGEHTFAVNKNVRVMPSAFYRYANLNDYKCNHRFGLSMNVLLSDRIKVGTSYETKEGVYAFVGIHDIGMSRKSEDKNKRNGLNIDFSFFMPSVNNYRTRVNSMELILKYSINKNGY